MKLWFFFIEMKWRTDLFYVKFVLSNKMKCGTPLKWSSVSSDEPGEIYLFCASHSFSMLQPSSRDPRLILYKDHLTRLIIVLKAMFCVKLQNYFHPWREWLLGDLHLVAIGGALRLMMEIIPIFYFFGGLASGASGDPCAMTVVFMPVTRTIKRKKGIKKTKVVLSNGKTIA